MGKNFAALLAARKQWTNEGKHDRLLASLEQAVVKEPDVTTAELLEACTGLSKAGVTISSVIYRALAERESPGWLAAAARESATNKAAPQRAEAARWLRFGRDRNRVTDEDLETLGKLLTDKDQDVSGIAWFTLCQFVSDAPELVIKQIPKWLPKVSAPQKPFVVAALVGAWGSAAHDAAIQLQAKWLEDPKLRGDTLRGLESAIQQQPPTLAQAEAGWDGLLLPSLERLLAGSWKRAAGYDCLVLYLLGTLLALRPGKSMIRKAEEVAERLVRSKDPLLPPTAIALGPWRSFGVFAPAVWKDYPRWWAKQLELAAKQGGLEIWSGDLEEDQGSLEELRSQAESTIPESELDDFRRSALEFAHGKRGGKK